MYRQATHPQVGYSYRSRAAAQRAEPRASQLILLVAGVAVFLISAAALIVPPALAGLAARATASGPAVAPAVAPTTAPAAALSRTDLERVVGYADTVQPDDLLVQVRPGVFAKRSNVSGVTVGERTVYYDVMPHQSFGPLRSGKVGEKDIEVLARVPNGDSLLLVYTLR